MRHSLPFLPFVSFRVLFFFLRKEDGEKSFLTHFFFLPTALVFLPFVEPPALELALELALEATLEALDGEAELALLDFDLTLSRALFYTRHVSTDHSVSA